MKFALKILLYIRVDGIKAFFMSNNTGLELNNDILYVQNIINKCTKTYRQIHKSFINKNKIFSSRLYFVCFQFRNVFDSGYWV